MVAFVRIAPYVWYPVIMGVAIILFVLLLENNISALVSLYASVGLVALAVLWLQQCYPARRAWYPSRLEVRADLAFMGLVQIALPHGLAALIVLSLAAEPKVEASDLRWPHTWPWVTQVGLMLLMADFMRYWLHRACHRCQWLWRLHAVHHSPDVLYSLNSGRFHPLEKALHFCVDSVPFLMLGVAPKVMAGYFLLYGANGLFQHSNLRLRYGLLNYVVASAETHRWHHARDARLAACNYGTTTLIWDVIFGTWRLPKRRTLGEVGIMDASYPVGFWAQLVFPFRNLEARIGAAAGRTLANVLVRLRLWSTLLIQGWRIARATRDPMAVQRALLRRILHENRDCAFGREHGFGETRGYESFVRNVPVSDYEALRPYIDAEIEHGETALTHAPPERYVRTSGSTGKPKDVPLTAEHLHALRRIHETAVAFQYRNCPEAFEGGILAIVSPAREGVLASGKPFGSASGIIAGDTPALVKDKFVLPADVFGIADSRVKYLLILRLALTQRDITYIGTANATTLLALITLYRRHYRDLIEDLRRGTFFLADDLPLSLSASIRSRLRACPERADELAAVHARPSEPRIADLWPNVSVVVTWTCASAGTAVSALRRELGPRTRVLELGYVASEFRATITLGRRADGGLPTFDTHFFEFVERDAWDRGEKEFLTLDRIRKGSDYYIIVTTMSGLYRYFINDVVRVTGFLHRTPLLRFVQKGRGVTNITGEKLYECQVLDAVRAAVAETGRALRFLVMLADDQARAYHLYIESDAGPRPSADALAQAVDARLGKLNLEYRAKRESERLGPVDAHWLNDHAGDAFKQFCVNRGQREGQFKPVALAYRKDIGFDFDNYVCGSERC